MKFVARTEVWAFVGSFLLWGIGLTESLLLGEVTRANGLIMFYLFTLQRDGFLQIGAIGMIAAVTVVGLRAVSGTRFEALQARSRAVLKKLCFSVVVFMVAGELLLRGVFWDGLSFGNHTGPLVRRFERDIQLNRYEGPSRGPEIPEAASKGSLRILVQGDSIAWGQGVRDTRGLFPAKLLEALRGLRPDVEMAVLAKGGREIDGHLDQLKKYKAEIQPDVIVYQWFSNDLELRTQGRRPKGRHRVWRRLFCHKLLSQFSYLWYLLDFQLDTLLPPPSRSYSTYLMELFEGDTPEWREFEHIFGEWTREARALTPRVVVVLYPYVEREGFRLAPIHAKMMTLSKDQEILAVDFAENLRDLSQPYKDVAASPYDGHPNVMTHNRLAERLRREIVGRWPELFVPPHSPHSVLPASPSSEGGLSRAALFPADDSEAQAKDL